MELKDIIAFTGIEAENMEDFKVKFSESFVPKTEYSKLEKEKSEIVGKTLGPIQTKLKSTFGLTAEETKDITTWEPIVEMIAAKHKAKEIEWTETSLKTADSQLKEANEKIEKLNRSKDEYKTAAQQAQEALQAKESEFAGKFKAFKSESIYKDSFLKVQPKLASLSEAEQFYLNNLVKENVIIDFDEEDQPIVLNKEGKRYTDPNKAGGFLSADQVIESIATEKNFIKKNNAGERTPIFTGNNNAGGNQQQNTEKKIHPNAQR